MTNEQNPPAFPSQTSNAEEMGFPEYGMSLRDWFAGQALLGMLSAHKIGALNSTDAACHAFGFADAMLAERVKRES